MSIKVEYAALEKAAGDIQQTNKYMNTALDDVKADVEKLCGTWTGQAQEAYRVQQKKWDDSADELNQILAKIGAAVNSARERYQKGETDIEKMVGG